ncbi:hypothetical protein V491_01797 [Pseudogymnoascus sp. VKM F-3775]|nr:hypothetical protein V491_01797 [Pseudogymnoascus sp. VKM F-3775]
MVTRAAAKRKAEFLAEAFNEKPVLEEKPIVSFVPEKPERAFKKKTSLVPTQGPADSKVISKSEFSKVVMARLLSRSENNALSTNVLVPLNKRAQDKAKGVKGTITKTPTKRGSRKRKADPADGTTVNGEIIKGGWDELPHNLGPAGDNKAESPILPIIPPDSIPRKEVRTSRAKKTINNIVATKDQNVAAPDLEARQEEFPGTTDQGNSQNKPKGGRKRDPKRTAKDAEALIEIKATDIEQNELTNDAKPEEVEDKKVAPKRKRKAPTIKKITPEKRAKLLGAVGTNGAGTKDQKPKKAQSARVAKKVDTSQDVLDEVNKLIEGDGILKKITKPKKNKYGLTPGRTPYPGFAMPTPEACLEVKNLLSGLHGDVEPPKAIPPPSLEVTGCGEVPSVLDALIRTRLSAATTSKNSAYAFGGLVSKFGILEDGIGKGSVDWNKVREADVEDVEAAIMRGGLAPTKSKDIKAILDMVHEENIARREAFVKEKETGGKVDVVGSESLGQGLKDLEIASADNEILSLQYMHSLTPDEAMEEFTKYPGIGVKTASCVILFCLRRPSFAVDTHVHRLCRWLKWIPEKANENKAFSHCEVRIPNEYKYSLHQLFIRHGRTCGRCRASTSETSEAWKETVCPIDHLVERTGLRKTLKPAAKMRKKKSGDEEDSDSDFTDLDEALFYGYAGNNIEMARKANEEK